MYEHHFKIHAPFARVSIVLRSMDTITVHETSELHVLATLASAGTLIARPTFPDAVDVIVAEPDGDSVAQALAHRLERLLKCDVSTPRAVQIAM